MLGRLARNTLHSLGLRHNPWVIGALARTRAGGRWWRERFLTDSPECAHCRSLDQVTTQRELARFLVETITEFSAKEQPAPIWQLPSETKLRYGTTETLASASINALRQRAGTRGFVCRLRTINITPNLYEFDGESDFPTTGTILELFPRAHCRKGKGYLAQRKVTLELLYPRPSDVFVPKAGAGPRFYPYARLAERAVTPSKPCLVQHWPFDIDLVYTWVDSLDPAWRRDYSSFADDIHAQARLLGSASATRWRSRDELKYSLRSADMYAPFIRKIFVVTNGQRPTWLKPNPRIEIVSHGEIYPDGSVLPTFNSNSIEANLHRIPGLAEHFLYLNDDFFFSRPCSPGDFFTIGGVSKLFFSPRYLDSRPINPLGRATVACHKFTRDLLQERFGQDCSQKFQHAPHALRKSAFEAIEKEFPAELARTRANRVRAHDDLALAFLYGYYALFTGSALAANIPYAYVELGKGDIWSRFREIRDRDVKVFCLNDSDSEAGVSEQDEKRIREILADRYPSTAPWEKE